MNDNLEYVGEKNRPSTNHTPLYPYIRSVYEDRAVSRYVPGPLTGNEIVVGLMCLTVCVGTAIGLVLAILSFFMVAQ